MQIHILIHNRSYPVRAYLDKKTAYDRYHQLKEELDGYGVVSLEIEDAVDQKGE
jgi:hypothetical protein